MVRIKARVDNVTTLNATLMKDQVGDCPADRAKYLVGAGLAELVEGDAKVPNAKGDLTERAVSPAAKAAETQTRKG
jgi:hypothetical protein